MRQLQIYRNGVYAGTLTEDDNRHYIFRYDDAYLNDPACKSVSLTLPKTVQQHESPTLFPFFFNMLSEGRNRQVQSRLLRIDESDDFGLLAATATTDTIGAVTVKALSL